MLNQLDPSATLEFIPESEEDEDKPTTIHIKPSGVRDSIRRNMLFVNSPDMRPGSQVNILDDEKYFQYIVSRIAKIENVSNGDGTITLSKPAEIEDAMDHAEGDWGLELLAFIIEKSKLAEKQRKN